MTCAACGGEHGVLESLPEKCLDAVPRLTDEEIWAALEAGRRDREAAMQHNPICSRRGLIPYRR